MWFWIIGAVVVLALAAWAFWPHRRGVVDDAVRQQKTDARVRMMMDRRKRI